jgi:phosphate-selective porin OprO and OprP
MKKSKSKISLLRVLFWASAMAFTPAANAQTSEKEAEPPADAPSPDDASVLTVSPTEADATPSDARAAILEAQVQSLQAQLDELKKMMTKATPTWKGSPQSADADAGWSFKPRGRLQYDAGYITIPGAYAVNRNLGFNSRVRRLRLGAEGTMPAGFGYKIDVDFANSAVGFGDAYLTFAPTGKAFSAKIGNQESLNGLDQITSSNYITFLERAQFNDAFTNTRRLGASFGYKNADDSLRIDAGLFTAHTIDASVDNDGWIGAARMVYSPYAFGGKIHLGLNYQHRDFQSNNNGVASTSAGAPSTNQIARYRARPFLQTTDVRFVDTGSFAARGDDIFGVELAGIFKNAYFASEVQILKARSYNAGTISTGLDAFAGGTAVTPIDNPTFFGAYSEFGIFLTGETRGYKEGTWNRTKVLKPFDKGGFGAIQLAARYDYLDLTTDKLIQGRTNNFANGTSTLGTVNSRLARGGTQTGYLLGLNWYPMDYVRFMFNYIHTKVEGGPLAATVKPLSTTPIDQRSYSTDGFAIRAQVDF